MTPAPGLLNLILFQLFVKDLLGVPPVKVDRCFVDGETLHELDGLQVIHTPGHSAGQVAFLWPQEGGLLFVGDAAANTLGLRLSISYEDLQLGKKTLARLAKLPFSKACFGRPMNRYVRDADAEAPAGGVSASVRDLSQWLRMQIAGGRWNGEQIIEAQALKETHQPTICKGESTNGECDPGVGFYGLGWDVSLDNAGHETLSHSGAFLLGTSTTVRFSPLDDIGIIVLSNTTPIGVPESIALTFMDLFQRGKLRVADWFEQLSPVFKKMTDDVENASPNYSKMPSPGSPSPGGPLGSYVGRYFNRYFGAVEIVKERDSLVMLLPPLGQHYDLQHWDGDTFTYYIAGESSAIGRRGVKFVEGRSLLLQNYVTKDESGEVYEDAVFVKEAE